MLLGFQAEGWLLLDIGWFVLFFQKRTKWAYFAHLSSITTFFVSFFEITNLSDSSM